MYAYLKRACLVLVLACWCGSAVADDGAAPVRYDGHKFVRVFVENWDQVQHIHALGGLLMSGREGLGPVDYLFPPDGFRALGLMGLPYEVLQEDIQVLIDAERASLARSGPVDPFDRTEWYENYKTHDEIYDKLIALQTLRPDLAEVFSIGESLEERPIWAIRITGPGGAEKPMVVLDATIHAREWITPMVVMWVADQLVNGYGSDLRVTGLVNQLEFVIIPVLNPDGYIHSWTTDRMWRKNRRPGTPCYGVDLNRNFGAGWGTVGSSSNPCSDTYHGTGPFSEPETQVFRDFFLANPRIVSGISYHSYSQLIMSPYGYTSDLPADHEWFMALNAAMHHEILAVHEVYYEYGPIYSAIYPVGGGTVDWCYDECGVIEFTYELRDTGQYGFLLPADQIIPNSEENLPAVLRLAEWSAKPIKFTLTDGRPERLTPDEEAEFSVNIRVLGGTLDPESPTLHTRVGTSGAYTQYPLTHLGEDLYRVTLPATPCGHTRQFYLSAANTVGLVARAPRTAPGVPYTAEARPFTVVLDANMDSNPGWTTQGQWAWGLASGAAGNPGSAFTGARVYGYNPGGHYTNNMPEFHLTTPALDCTNSVDTTLSFYRWLGVESFANDRAYVRISTDGTNWTNLWQNTTANLYDGEWVHQRFNISAIADGQPNVYLRWTMGPTNGTITYCGWNIDDVVVWGADPAGCPQLLGDLNCDDLVNAFDIDPFVLALTDSAAYALAYPDCDYMLADINGDGLVNAFDIDPFVQLLTGRAD
jgi:murein tripeptide amidase MpaA